MWGTQNQLSNLNGNWQLTVRLCSPHCCQVDFSINLHFQLSSFIGPVSRSFSFIVFSCFEQQWYDSCKMSMKWLMEMVITQEILNIVYDAKKKLGLWRQRSVGVYLPGMWFFSGFLSFDTEYRLLNMFNIGQKHWFSWFLSHVWLIQLKKEWNLTSRR